MLMVLTPAAAICLVLLPLVVYFCCLCRKRSEKYVTNLLFLMNFFNVFRYRPSSLKSPIHFRETPNQGPALYPGDTLISHDQMPLYINCTEVTHIYTNGSYQLVYQNSTPLFVHTKQVFYYGDIRVLAII